METKLPTYAETAKQVVDTLRRLGIEPHSQSRVMEMYRVLTTKFRVLTPDQSNFPIALEAVRDLQLLNFSLDQLQASFGDPGFKMLVVRLLDDAVLPQDSSEQTPGRDFQFELFVGAVCQSAGLSPVKYEEPDVTCVLDGKKYCIAAKRIKNVSQLEKRIRKAVKQIQTSGMPGFIALDPCIALNQDNNRFLIPVSDGQYGDWHKFSLTTFIQRQHDKIQNLVKGNGVRGLLIHDHHVRLEPDKQWSLCSTTMTVPTFGNYEKHMREFQKFTERYLIGLPNRQKS